MSNDEQDVSILRVVKSRAEAKKRKTLLENELRAAGQSLYRIGSGLQSVGNSTAVHESPAALIQQIAQAPEICDLRRIGIMLSELKEVMENLQQINTTARELGIE
jgi:hypothetical protein